MRTIKTYIKKGLPFYNAPFYNARRFGNARVAIISEFPTIHSQPHVSLSTDSK